MKHIHLIGIGGSGLSAIARVLLESGYTVSGSDRTLSSLALDLQKAGAKVYAGHDEKNISGADIVVRSSAIPDSNPEVVAAYRTGIPVQKRADFLGNLISFRADGSPRTALAISGTHGKTTTTAMVAWILQTMKLDPSFIIGGVSKNLHCNAHAGNGDYFVIEADEYDNMFLGLSPDLILLTNVQYDHPDCFPTRECYLQAYASFAGRLNSRGTMIACAEDEGALETLQSAPIDSQKYTYGTSEQCHYQIKNALPGPKGGYEFEVWFNLHPSAKETDDHQKLASISLQVPGKHNMLNATGALAMIHRLNLQGATHQAAEALSQFEGTGRRFDIQGKINGITVVDDYAHHPVEIKATIDAARDRYPNNRIWVVWQPHTFSRIKAMFEEFIHAFDQANELIITEIYAARETDDSFTSADIVKRMKHPGLHAIFRLDDAAAYLCNHLEPGDVLLVLSAGDADQISSTVLDDLKKRGA